jgi:hypothetical protein
MGVPIVVGVGAAVSGAAAVTAAYPAAYTPVVNDVAVTFVECHTTDTLTPPSGWALITAANASTGTAPTKLSAIWRRVQAGDTAPSIADAGDHIVARMIVFRGCATTGNPWDVIAQTTELTADTTVSIAALTTTKPNCLILAAFSTGQATTSTAGATAWANAALTSVTEQMDNWATAGTGGGFSMATGIKATAGSTGATTATLSLTANFKAQLHIALKGSDDITQTDSAGLTDSRALAIAKTQTDSAGLTDTSTAGIPPSTIYTTQADAGVATDFDGLWYTTGVLYRLDADGILTGGRAYFPSPRPASNFIWAVFRVSDQAIVAQVDLLATFPTATLNAWNHFTSAAFNTPGNVNLSAYPGEQYIVVTATNQTVAFETGATYPISSGGIVHGIEGRVFNGGTGLTFPATTETTTYHYADVDIAAAPAGLSQTVTDSAGLADGRVLDSALARTDSAGLTDAAAAAVALSRTDSAGLTDTTSMARTATVTDLVGLDESNTIEVIKSVSATDSAGLTDAATLTSGGPVTDSAGLTDATSMSRTAVATDSAGLTDLSLLDRWVTVTDAAGLTDAATLTSTGIVTDSAGLTDTVGLAIGVPRTDSAGLTDSAVLARSLERTDSAGLTDSSTVQAAKLVAVTDSAGLTDARMLDVVMPRTDSAGLTDSAVLAGVFARTDSAGLTDGRVLTLSKTQTDSAGLTDAATLVAGAVRTDSAGLTDTAVVTPVKQAGATDSAGLSDGWSMLTGFGTIFLPGGLVPVRALSAEEIITSNRSTRFRYDLYSRVEAPLGNLDGVEKGSVDFVANASVKSGGSLEVVATGQTVDWLNDRVRPVAIIEGLPEIPLGMFLFSEAPEEWDDTGASRAVKLLDKTTILDQDAVDGTYSLDTGTVITTAVVTLITSTGETNIAVTPSAATLAAPLAWEAGTTKLRIVNDLLAVAGYFSLFCDGNGQYRGEPYIRPAARPIRYEFLDGATSIYSPEFVKDVDLFSIPNKFVAVGQGSGIVAALTSTATNTDPASPYSFGARGRWITKSATGVEAASQTVLDDYARRRLIELTSPTSSIEVEHALVPGLALNNAVRLRRVPAGVDARHVVSKMVIALDPLALVKSTLVEVVDL